MYQIHLWYHLFQHFLCCFFVSLLELLSVSCLYLSIHCYICATISREPLRMHRTYRELEEVELAEVLLHIEASISVECGCEDERSVGITVVGDIVVTMILV